MTTHSKSVWLAVRGDSGMRRHDPSDFVVPEQFWDRPDTDAVLRARDAGALFQLVRQYAGASQTGLTMRTGIAKSEISAIMAGSRRVTSLDRFESIADGLDMPDEARLKMGLAPRNASPSSTTAPTPVQSSTPLMDSAGSVARVWNILPPIRGFRGRDAEIVRIANHLLEQDGRDSASSIAVHGIAGVGKTQLARAYADIHRSDYRLGWWLSAETPLDLATGIGQLAVRLGASEDWSPPELLNYVFDELRQRDSWLLIFDNATTPADVESFIPSDGGERAHVIITSRNPAWRTLAVPVGVDVLPVDSASQLLAEWSHDEDAVAAEALAKELGQLPLAIEQAAAYAVDTSISLTDYLELFRIERTKVLQKASAITYPGTIAATVILTMDKLALTAPMAMRLLEISALCSPDDLPLKQFLTVLQNLEDPRISNLDAVGRLDVLSSLRQSGLLRWDTDDAVRLHRLTRVVIEDRIRNRRQRVSDGIDLLTALFPRSPSEPENWPTCAQLASHATSVFTHARREDLVNESLASLLTRVGRYFLCSGLSFADARDLHDEALRMRRTMHRGDHPEVARGLVHLAVDLNELGDPTGARELHSQALAMRRRLYAQDHPDVAHSLDNLGNVLHILRDFDRARQHHQLGLEMRQRLYAGDHPNVAYSLSNLAGDLHKLGDITQARQLNEQALAMRQRLVPGDHPDIGHSLSNLAIDLHALGEYGEAKELNSQALAMRRRLYPGDHPNIQQSLLSLAENCRALGETSKAGELTAEASSMQERLMLRARRPSDQRRRTNRFGVPVTKPAIRPRQLRAGDRGVIVSPSSTIADQAEAARCAAAKLETLLGLELELSEHALGEYFYSAGTADERAGDLMAAIVNPEVSVVLFSMGGATAIDIIDRLDYEAISENPKVIAGLSDSSTLLNAITAKTGLVTFHGFEMLDFSRHEMAYNTESIDKLWFNRWSGDYTANPKWRDLQDETTSYRSWREIKPGEASGMAVGGNSDAFMQLVDTPFCPPLDGSVLFLETYRLQKRHIQALLAHLKLRSVFDRLGGLVLGYCLGSDAPGTGNERDIAEIIREVTTGYDFPVMQVGEIGHQVENLILPVGATVQIDTRRLSISLPEPAVLSAG